jgi:transposase
MLADRIEALLADKGYDADVIRTPIPHDREKYRWRNLVERLFNKLKNWRRVATRYDKTAEAYLGFVALASVTLWLPFVHAA